MAETNEDDLHWITSYTPGILCLFIFMHLSLLDTLQAFTWFYFTWQRKYRRTILTPGVRGKTPGKTAALFTLTAVRNFNHHVTKSQTFCACSCKICFICLTLKSVTFLFQKMRDKSQNFIFKFKPDLYWSDSKF